MTFNSLCEQIHAINIRWWQNPATGLPIERDRFEMLALVHSEISEALEGERKGKLDDHILHRMSAEVEMADALIRLLDYCGGWQYDMDAAFNVHHVVWLDRTIRGGTAKFKNHIFSRKGRRAAQLNSIHDAISAVSISESEAMPAVLIAQRLAAVFVLIFDYCGTWNYNLFEAVTDKLAYNARRIDHTAAARLALGGKQF